MREQRLHEDTRLRGKHRLQCAKFFNALTLGNRMSNERQHSPKKGKQKFYSEKPKTSIST